MIDKKSYWVILGDNIDYPSLSSAKIAVRHAVANRTWNEKFYGNVINHFVNQYKRTCVYYHVTIYGKVTFSRPQRV